MSESKSDPYSLARKENVGYLLNLVMQDAARNLEEDILESLRPKVRDYVYRALEDLKPRIEMMMNPYERELVVRLTTGDDEPTNDGARDRTRTGTAEGADGT